MEKGVIRFEANVSVRETGSNELKTRTEIKNLNSFRAMMRAIDFEIERQSEMLRQGLPVVQETLGWDETLSKTTPQRSKEEAHDYRYFPEPDLPPLFVDPSWIVKIRKELPELPDEKRQRLVQAYSLSSYTARILTEDRTVADFFEDATKAAPDIAPQKIANWISGDLFGILHEDNLLLKDSPVSPSALANLVTMVEDGEINASIGKLVLEKMVHSGEMPEDIVEAGDLAMVKDPSTVRTLVVKVIDENPQQLETYLAGKSGIADWFFGQVMRASRGKADPALVRKVLYEELRNKEESRRAEG
jgi:aspartyl-tRNA(Asn)/glutamyl-tRNA(Gln) amidotransferase subunit B